MPSSGSTSTCTAWSPARLTSSRIASTLRSGSATRTCGQPAATRRNPWGAVCTNEFYRAEADSTSPAEVVEPAELRQCDHRAAAFRDRDVAAHAALDLEG